LAGGSWNIVSELIDDVLCRAGINVFVYDLPGAEPKLDKQLSLLPSSGQPITSILN